MKIHHKIALGILVLVLFIYFICSLSEWIRNIINKDEEEKNIIRIHTDTHVTESSPSMSWGKDEKLWIYSEYNNRIESFIEIGEYDITKLPISSNVYLMVYVPEECKTISSFSWHYSDLGGWSEGDFYCSGTDRCVGKGVLNWNNRLSSDEELGKWDNMTEYGWYSLDISKVFRKEQEKDGIFTIIIKQDYDIQGKEGCFISSDGLSKYSPYILVH